jgi:hypothetical protein
LCFVREERAGIQEIFNPFPTIAVWAAVKFVVRRAKFAFLPLICDPESQEKHRLFHDLFDEGEDHPAASRRRQDEIVTLVTNAGQHPPLFACVMRKVGTSRVLECHGFVCSSSEDAIVLAANLYQALLDNMRADETEREQNDESDMEHRLRSPRPRSCSMRTDRELSSSLDAPGNNGKCNQIYL